MATKDRKRPMSGDEIMLSLQGLTSGVEVAQRSQGSFLPLAGGTIAGALVVGGSEQVDGHLGVGTEPPFEHQAHIAKNQDVEEPAWEPEDVLLLAGAAAYNVVLTILSASTMRGGIAFADPDQRVAGAISYDHGDETLRLFTENVRRLAISALAAVFEQPLDVPLQTVLVPAPDAGYMRLYPASDGIHYKDAAGVDRLLSAGGGATPVDLVPQFLFMGA